MKACITFLLLAGLNLAATADTFDVVYGSFDAPEGFALKQTGTKDSYTGTLTRSSDGFTISISAGFGIYMNFLKPDKYALFRRHPIHGNGAFTGIERVNGKVTIATTICDWCEQGLRNREERAALGTLPPNQRETRARELGQQMSEINKLGPDAASFRADITREDDLVEFMLIVSSFRARGETP